MAICAERRLVDEMKQAPDTSDDALGRLLRLAGPRPAPARATRDEVYAQVRATWEARQRHTRRRRYLLAGAAAAGIAAIGLVLLWPAPHSVAPPVSVATVERVFGEVVVSGSEARLQPGAAVPRARALRTVGDSMTGLRLANGASLRIAPATVVQLDTAREFELVQGRIYLDTTGAPPAVQFVVRTPAGEVRDVGTQFEVYSGDAQVRVRVRDGEIEFATASGTVAARRGEALVATPGRGVLRQRFAPTDPAWDWARSLAPAFATDGARIAELVAWVGRESGREVVYADAATRNAARLTRLSGSIEGLPPEQTLSTALAATRLQARIDDARIVVTRAGR